MITKIKPLILTIAAFFSLLTFSYSQFSVEAGLSLPIGEYADDDEGSAGIGFNLRGGWDKLLNDNVGIATGVIIGGNSFAEDEAGIDVGSWTYFALEVGVLVQATEQINFKGMLVRAGASSPEISIGNQVLISSGSAGAFGFDVRVEYEITQFYISANYMAFTPEFSITDGSNTIKEKISMSSIGISAGYKF